MVDVASISSIAGGKKIRGLKLQTGLSTTAASSFDRDCHIKKEKLFKHDNWIIEILKYLLPLFGKM